MLCATLCFTISTLIPATIRNGSRIWTRNADMSPRSCCGAGKAFGSCSSDGDVIFGDAPAPVTYGLGYRYEIAKAFKLLAGFDVARHKVDTSVYITVGSAWNAFY